MNLRKNIFWTIDRLRGGLIRDEVTAIERAMRVQNRETGGNVDLHRMLEHTWVNVPYYQEFKGATLTDFPVVDKAEIKRRGFDMIARGYSVAKLHIASTSGSTGTPFRVYQDAGKRRRVAADAIYWGRQAGYEVGVPLYHMKVWSDRNKISRSKRFMQNIIPVDTTDIGEPNLERVLAQMRASRGPISIISYSSVLESIAKYAEMEESHIHFDPGVSVSSIIGQSEALSGEARAALRKLFGKTPYARYGLEELGIVAQQVCEQDNVYQINHATHLVEVLREGSDVPAEPGEMGRIVVTDLFNHGQPMIRYDTGDLGVFATKQDGSIDYHRLREIHGRQADRVYDVNDNPLSNMLMYNLWWKFEGIEQYQLIQTGRGEYVLRLRTSPHFSASDVFAEEFRKIVGLSARISVEITDDNFVLSSGRGARS